jgi:hypothetical protein
MTEKCKRAKTKVSKASSRSVVGLRRKFGEDAAGGPAVRAPYDDLAREIGESATRVTDEQVASILRATGSEKAAFEVIAAAALGAGLPRWRKGIKALDEVSDAPA